MQVCKITLFLLSVTLISMMNMAHAEAINLPPPKFTIFTEGWVPFQYETEKGETTGMAVELLEKILKGIHSTQDRSDMHIIPWTRAVRSLEDENSIVFSMTVTDERLPKYHWVGPIYEITNSVYILADSRLSESDFNVGNSLTTAIVLGDVNFQYMPDLFIDTDRVTGVTSDISPIKMLHRGRVDFIIDNNLNFKEVAERAKLDIKKFKKLFSVDSSAISFALSKKTSEVHVKRMQDQLNSIKHSSEYIELLEKYDLE